MTTINKGWVLITGASGGFGEECARQFTAQEKSLILVARRLTKLESMAQELRESDKTEVIVEQVDLSDMFAISDLHSRLKQRNIVVDTLINNAGQGLQGSFRDQPLNETLDMINLDIVSVTALRPCNQIAEHENRVSSATLVS
ncbi:SDR family NAD(P)-dependent oxidoreductase [Sodalis sp. RH23]|uniref:SDR family NAD(P)-dependent oxidoreductase n=1 Tax=unclassified Sodalis (in: enterobacteria) TaxID=2636512 RepID=UPI0039B46869